MRAARLYGPSDIRIDNIDDPTEPAPGEVTIAVGAVGVCGSDLHTYRDARIGSTGLESPLVLGHEFGGTIVALGRDARDGNDNPLKIGQRVAVDPATPCYRCEFCEKGHPNLCRRLHFCGLYPDDGSLREYMNVGARECYPIPDSVSDAGAALLEPLGVAMHAVDLAKLKVANTVVIQGAGAIGLMILQLAKLSGAHPIYMFDLFSWRIEKACAWGADKAWTLGKDDDPVEIIKEETNGRGADVVFEAAWADHSVAQAAEMCKLGGRLMLVGIPSDDGLSMRHSTARRKGLSIIMSRRMKHVYPRAIEASTEMGVKLDDMVSHRFPLEEADRAFNMNHDYSDNVQKVVIDVASA